MTLSLLCDLVAPLGLFYGLRVFGVNQWLALVLSAVFPLMTTVIKVMRERKVDGLSLEVDTRVYAWRAGLRPIIRRIKQSTKQQTTKEEYAHA